jgi:antitoxin CcdA
VLNAAKAFELNISQVCDSYLRQLVIQEQERRRRNKHADFIAAYNCTIKAESIPLSQGY